MLYCKNDFEKELFDLAVPRSFEKYDPEMPMIIEHLSEMRQYLDAIEYVNKSIKA